MISRVNTLYGCLMAISSICGCTHRSLDEYSTNVHQNFDEYSLGYDSYSKEKFGCLFPKRFGVGLQLPTSSLFRENQLSGCDIAPAGDVLSQQCIYNKQIMLALGPKGPK